MKPRSLRLCNDISAVPDDFTQAELSLDEWRRTATPSKVLRLSIGPGCRRTREAAVLQLAELLCNQGRAVEAAQRTSHRLTPVIFQRHVTAKRDFLRFSQHSGDSPPPTAAGIAFRSPFLSVTLLEHINQSVLSTVKLVARLKDWLLQRAWKLKRFSGHAGHRMTTAGAFLPNERRLMVFRG